MKQAWKRLQHSFSSRHDDSPQSPPVVRPAIHSGRGDNPPSVNVQVLGLGATVLAAHSGPDAGVQNLAACRPDMSEQWDRPCHWACGHSTSMYDANPATGQRNGDPIADCFAVVGYPEGALLAVADGVSWGEPARRAARCAVLASCAHLHHILTSLPTASDGHGGPGQPSGSTSSAAVFAEMHVAIAAAQKLILQQCGTLTTLVLSVVMPTAPSTAAPAGASSPPPRPAKPDKPGAGLVNTLKGLHPWKSTGERDRQHKLHSNSLDESMPWDGKGPAGGAQEGARGERAAGPEGPWVVLTLTVGDSAAWVWRTADGSVEELTAAAHAGVIRDPRWTPGALGYALGEEPDLSNLSTSITYVQAGDLVFLGTDGVVDNLDPIMLKTARPAPHASEVADASDPDGLPALDLEGQQAGMLANLAAAIQHIPPPTSPGVSDPPQAPLPPSPNAASAAPGGAHGQTREATGGRSLPGTVHDGGILGGKHLGTLVVQRGGVAGAGLQVTQVTPSAAGTGTSRLMHATGAAGSSHPVAPGPSAAQGEPGPPAAGMPSALDQLLMTHIRVSPATGGGSFKGNVSPSAPPNLNLAPISGPAAPSQPPQPAVSPYMQSWDDEEQGSPRAARKSQSFNHGMQSVRAHTAAAAAPGPMRFGPAMLQAQAQGARQGLPLGGRGRPAGPSEPGKPSGLHGMAACQDRPSAGPVAEGQEHEEDDGRAPGCVAQDAAAALQGPGLTAQCLVEGLLRHIYKVTEPHRQFLERRAAIAAGLTPAPYTVPMPAYITGGGRGADAAEANKVPRALRSLATDSPNRTSMHSAFTKTPPGKLDHVTVVAYQVGRRLQA